MKTISFIFILSSVLLFTGACTNSSMDTMNTIGENGNKETVNPDYPIEITGIDFSLPESCGWVYYFPMDAISREVFFVVNSPEELKKYPVSCDKEITGINFDHYSMIIVFSTYMGQGNASYHLLQTDEKHYRMEVDMPVPPVSFGEIVVLVPKLPQDAILELYVNHSYIK
jgi:hypothetical protein